MKISSLFLLSALCGCLCGCSGFDWSDASAIKGSGKIASETRPVSQFDRVSVSGSGVLSIVQGDEEGLTIEADDNLLPLIKSEVADGLLKVGPDHGNFKPTRLIYYQLRLKNLKELHLSGSLEAVTPSLHADQLLLSISGSGNIKVPKLETAKLEVHVSGSGDLDLAGKAEQQTVRISGSGNYRAGDCASQNTTIQVSGSGDATVWARQALEAQVSGSGDIRYYGAPQVNSHVSGSGSIRSLGNK
jgi:hypothetical protein